MAFPGRRVQRRLRPCCRASQYSCTLSLIIFTIYVYFTRIRLQMKSVPQWKTGEACSANEVATPKGCVPCLPGTFSFPDWSECKPWLNCSEIALQIHPISRFHHGITKRVWHAEWRGYHVVFVNCSASDPVKRERCSKGLSNLEQIQGQFATRLVGKCPEKLQVRKTMTHVKAVLGFLRRKRIDRLFSEAKPRQVSKNCVYRFQLPW